MIGILTEKPSAARNFAKALGGMSGKYKGEDYVIVHAAGHLYQFVAPEAQVPENLKRQYSSWKSENLPWSFKDFSWKYEKSKGANELLKEIKEKLSKCSEIAIGTDLDPTGEGMYLAAEILFNLKLNNKKLTRIEFVDESEASLQKAFSTRKPIKKLEDDLEYRKAYFRSRWDFLSMQFTRIATNLYPFGFKVVRQGRLKSTMVYLVGEAIEKLNKYEKIPYFQNRFIDENKVVYINSKEPQYETKDLVPNIYKTSDVVLDKKTMKSSPPPKLLDLSKLSSLLAPRGYSAKEVLATYQAMYQDQILSYPRTTDKNITNEQFNEMLPLIDSIAKLVDVDNSKLTVRKPRKTHVQDKGSHGANRPGKVVPKSLKSLEKYGRSAIAIYTILAKNFLAMFAEDYEYENQKGHIKDYPDFKGSVNVPKKLGWKEIFVSDEVDEEENSRGLGKTGEPFIYEGYPPKPPAPTMGWLMKQLEKNNVGSGATRTSTYSEVTSKSSKNPLLIDTRGKITMTELGEFSHQILHGTKIGDVKTTEHVLDVMEKIGRGDLSIENTELEAVKDLVLFDLKKMQENSKKVEFKKTKYPIVEKVEVTDKETGDVKSFKKEWGNRPFTEEEIKKLSNGETIEIRGLVNKYGKKYNVKGRLEDQTYKGKTFYGFKVLEFVE